MDSAPTLLTRGLESFRAGAFEEARSAFEQAVELDPRSAVANFDLASALFQLKHYAAAEGAYLLAADLDKTIAPLATYNAGLAASERDQLSRAIELFQSAQDLAIAAHREALADKARQAGDALRERRLREERERMLALARFGKEALHAGRAMEAAASYQQALAIAEQIGAPAGDQAELHFGVGSCELREESYDKAVAAFQTAVDLAPREAEFHLMLGVANYRAGKDEHAEVDFEAAIALGLSHEEQVRAETYLELLWDRRIDSRRVAFEARVALGYDSDVPQSGAIPSLTNKVTVTESAAPYVGADFDAQWRPLGDARNGLVTEYRFSQLAYISVPLDPYSIQSNDVDADATWTPAHWLTLDADFDVYLMFAGIETFGPFQDGLRFTPRATFREGRGFETVASYSYTRQWSLDPNYNYLSGTHDDFGVSETLRGGWGRVTLAYQFHLEQVGNELAPVTEIPFPCPAAPAGSPPCPPAATNVYVIPYSYSSQELTLTGAVNLPSSFRAKLDLDFEYRPYIGDSYIVRPADRSRYYFETRLDHRYSLDATISRTFGRRYSLQLEYTLQLNVSDINYNLPATRLDYDDKNYVRQVIELSAGMQF